MSGLVIICSKCDIEQSVCEFYLKRKELCRTNILSYDKRCKSCRKQYRKSDSGKESLRRYENSEKGKRSKRKYRLSEKGKIAEEKYRKSSQGILTRDRAISKYKERNTNKVFAREAVRQSVRKGSLIRPSKCKNCKKECFVQAHHFKGYEKESWLEIEWLCIKCHNKEHI